MSVVSCPSCHAAVSTADAPGAGPAACPACGHVFPVAAEAPPPEPPPSADPPPGVYPVIPFAASRGGVPAGLGVAVFTGLVAAVVLAVVCLIVRSFFWLVIVFPALHGLAVGAATGLGGRLAKTRLPVALGAAAACAGLVSVLALHYLQYLAVIANPAVPPLGFWEFMDLRATEGVRIGKAGGGGNGAGLGYTGTIIYWLVEAGITAGAAAGVAASMVGSPFCEGCNKWKRKRTLGPYRAEPMHAAQAVAAGVPAGIVAPAEGDKKVTLDVYACPVCGPDGTVDVSMTGTHTVGKQTTTCKVFMTYPGEALAAFEDADRVSREVGLKRT